MKETFKKSIGFAFITINCLLNVLKNYCQHNKTYLTSDPQRQKRHKKTKQTGSIRMMKFYLPS